MIMDSRDVLHESNELNGTFNDYRSKTMTEGFDREASANLGFLEYLAEGVLILDGERVIQAANSALIRMVGWSAEELVGKHCREIFCCQHPATATFLCDNLCPLQALIGGNPQKLPFYYQQIAIATKSGDQLSVSASFAPLELPVLAPSGATPPAAPASNIIVTLRDVSEHMRQEKIKIEFVATASHQLRTPLSSIKTSIGLLLDNVGADFNPPLLRLLHNIQGSSLRMERLVNDLIELTRLQSGRIQMQHHRIEVLQLVEKSVELSFNIFQIKQQRLKLSLPSETLYVEADYGRITQVLQHLLSNASKFSSPGSTVELKVFTRESTGRKAAFPTEVVFSVRDEGIGIAPEEQSMIFEKFYQGQVTENTGSAGSGLGLPLAKALVELNGGRLWFESELHKGSTFYFSLPAASHSF